MKTIDSWLLIVGYGFGNNLILICVPQDFSDGIRLLGKNLMTWHPEKKIQAMQMVVHSADIANPAKPLRFSQQWVDRVLREFFAQVCSHAPGSEAIPPSLGFRSWLIVEPKKHRPLSSCCETACLTLASKTFDWLSACSEDREVAVRIAISKRIYLVVIQLQGDLEKERGLKVSPQCDREKVEIARSQLAFLERVVRPCYMTLQMLAPNAAGQALAIIEAARQHWETLLCPFGGKEVLPKALQHTKDPAYANFHKSSSELKLFELEDV